MPENKFERIEKKYMLSAIQYRRLCEGLDGRMQIDRYGKHTISNIYYDTEDNLLIRSSIEKPAYKEKLRLRCYGTALPEKTAFIELKKKVGGVVYKRRSPLPLSEAERYLAGTAVPQKNQVLREVDYFLSLYRPAPRIVLSYERIALADEKGDLRITFDRNIRFRQSALSLQFGSWGYPITGADETLMEIKIPGAVPLWLSHLLSENRIYPTTFSKYGVCYRKYLCTPSERKDLLYA